MNLIIAAYAGTGKTHFASLYPQKVIDFVCMPYKYHLDHKTIFDESSKADFNDTLNVNWPSNYVSAIKEYLNYNKIILIPSDLFVLKLLRKENIEYTLCYPKRDDKEIYLKRYINRCNNEYFIDIFIGNWDNFMDAFMNDTFGKHIILESNQYLSDAIDVSTYYM